MEPSSLDRVFVVEDHTLLRDGLVRAIGLSESMQVAGAFGDARSALDAAHELQPDVVLLDIVLPGLNAFDAARRLRAVSPELRIVVLTGFPSDQHIEQALKLPVDGFLTKDEPMAAVIQALKDVIAGGCSYSQGIREHLGLEADGTPREELTPHRRLTCRELQVLGYLADGMTRPAIACVMKISPRTVDRHVENIMGKTGLHDRVALARFAVCEGLVGGVWPRVASCGAAPRPVGRRPSEGVLVPTDER